MKINSFIQNRRPDKNCSLYLWIYPEVITAFNKKLRTKKKNKKIVYKFDLKSL